MAKKKGMTLYHIAEILLIIGGINWGLVGVFDFNLVSFLLGTGLLANIVYGVVGASGIYLAIEKIRQAM